MRSSSYRLGLTAAAALTLAAFLTAPPGGSTAAAATRPLAGKVVVIDPGHQLGNFSHPAQIARPVNAGGFTKPCNTTGTSTNSGYRESAFAMSTATYLRARLEAQGARVSLTRSTESSRLWGPCVDARGRLGNTVHADAVVSIHADGTASGHQGFFVIRPAYRTGWTDDTYTVSRTLSLYVRAGLESVHLPRANYYGGDGLDTRGDLGTLNWSDVPIVMVELGNMRNPTDARQMQSAAYRDRVYAAGLAQGLRMFLTR
jgi:N-acetylmuramoyl-L-alanine amidase